MKRLLKKYPATLYGIAVIMLLTMEEYQLWCTAGDAFSPYVIVYSIIDISLIFAPYWWLRGRWRMTALVPVWLFSIYFLCNSLYFRFWGMLMPLSQFGQAKNINEMLVDSALGVFSPADLLYVTAPLIATVPWLLPRLSLALQRQSINRRFRIVSTCCAICAYLALIPTLYYRHLRNSYSVVNISWETIAKKSFDDYLHPEAHILKSHRGIFFYGFICHLYYELRSLSEINTFFKLNAEQRDSIDRYLAARESAPSLSTTGRNLVLIIVESLNADAMGLTANGTRLTPVLDSLAAAENSIACKNVLNQTREGHSVDGQMMYNLGVLPTFSGVASCDFIPKMAEIPTLPYLLPAAYYSEAIIASDGLTWNEMRTQKHYGYNNTFSYSSFKEWKKKSKDGAMFDFALEQLQDMPEPFLLELITSQMHVPYKTDGMEKVDFAGMGLTEERQRYLTCTADFDRHLGRFLQGLREAGLADNTMVVIASDHNAPSTTKPDGSPADIVFIAANAGCTLHIDEPVHQVDVFPTILDLMGVQSAWRGVGHSMLGPQRGESDPRQATVSDSILRSDYFPLQ